MTRLSMNLAGGLFLFLREVGAVGLADALPPNRLDPVSNCLAGSDMCFEDLYKMP